MRKSVSDYFFLLLYGLQALLLTRTPWHDWLHAIPRGSEGADTVPLFNLWTLRWTFLASPGEWWHAPIFYPTRGAFALSDPQPLTGLLAWPWQALSPALAYNLVLLLFLVLNAWSAYRLLRWLGVERIPSLAAGALLMALPFFTHERGVLQLQPVFGMIWAWRGLWGLWRDENTWPDAARLGLGVTVTFALSEYYGLFLVILLAPPALWMLYQRPRLWRPFLAAGTGSLLVLAPYLWPQMSILKALAYRRSLETIQSNSASLFDWLQATPTVWGSKLMPRIPWHKQHLFPGLVLLGLGASGGWLAARQPAYRRWARWLGGSAVMALILSLPWPYILLYHLPGIGNLRSPFRWLVWVQMVLALLAAHSLQHLWQRRRWLFALVLTLALLENAPRNTPWAFVPAPFPPDTLQGPTLFLPLPDGSTPKHYEPTARWMVQAQAQDAWLVNGYSGYIPSLQRQMRVVQENFPNDYSLQLLADAGIETLAVDEDWLSAEQRQAIEAQTAAGALPPPRQVDGLLLFHWETPSPNLLQTFDGRWLLNWRLRDDTLRLYLAPRVEAQRGYLLAPDLAPFQFQVEIAGELLTLAPHRAFFFYPGNQRQIYFDLPWSDVSPPEIHLQAVNGRPVAP